MCAVLDEHVAMVFHRFLENKVRGKRLAIYIQDDKVTPWDPFVANEPKRKALEPGEIAMHLVKSTLADARKRKTEALADEARALMLLRGLKVQARNKTPNVRANRPAKAEGRSGSGG
jgi:hypothetical protein